MDGINLPESLIKTIQDHLQLAIGSLINQPISLEIIHQGVISIPEVHKLISSTNSQVTTVYIPIMGDVVGDIFMFLPDVSANHLVDCMTSQPLGTNQVIDDFGNSAIKEMGNITSGVIITELANNLHLSMMLTTPNIAKDMPGALVDQVLIEYGENSNDLMAIYLTFKVESVQIEAQFLMMFDKNSSEFINSKINK